MPPKTKPKPKKRKIPSSNRDDIFYYMSLQQKSSAVAAAASQPARAPTIVVAQAPPNSPVPSAPPLHFSNTQPQSTAPRFNPSYTPSHSASSSTVMLTPPGAHSPFTPARQQVATPNPHATPSRPPPTSSRSLNYTTPVAERTRSKTGGGVLASVFTFANEEEAFDSYFSDDD